MVSRTGFGERSLGLVSRAAVEFSSDVHGFLLLIPKSIPGCIGVNDMLRLHLSLTDNKVEVELGRHRERVQGLGRA
jgi:hypothetical protein